MKTIWVQRIFITKLKLIKIYNIHLILEMSLDNMSSNSNRIITLAKFRVLNKILRLV